MRNVSSQIEGQEGDTRASLPPQLLTVSELCAVFGISPAWVYKRTKKGAPNPPPVFRLSGRVIRLNSNKIFCLSLDSRKVSHRCYAEAIRRNCPGQRKGQVDIDS